MALQNLQAKGSRSQAHTVLAGSKLSAGAGCAHLEKYEKVNGKDDIPYVSIYYILLYISHMYIYIHPIYEMENKSHVTVTTNQL